MKRVFLTFVMAALLTASLTACTTRPADTNSATGKSGTTHDATARSRARTGGSNGDATARNGDYYANDKGNVYDRGRSIGNDMRRAADDVMDGVDNAIRDMTHE